MREPNEDITHKEPKYIDASSDMFRLIQAERSKDYDQLTKQFFRVIYLASKATKGNPFTISDKELALISGHTPKRIARIRKMFLIDKQLLGCDFLTVSFNETPETAYAEAHKYSWLL